MNISNTYVNLPLLLNTLKLIRYSKISQLIPALNMDDVYPILRSLMCKIDHLDKRLLKLESKHSDDSSNAAQKYYYLVNVSHVQIVNVNSIGKQYEPFVNPSNKIFIRDENLNIQLPPIDQVRLFMMDSPVGLTDTLLRLHRYLKTVPKTGSGTMGNIIHFSIIRDPEIVSKVLSDICDIFNETTKKEIEFRYIDNTLEQWCYDMSMDHYEVHLVNKKRSIYKSFSVHNNRTAMFNSYHNPRIHNLTNDDLITFINSLASSGQDKVYEDSNYIVCIGYHGRYITKIEKESLYLNISVRLGTF